MWRFSPHSEGILFSLFLAQLAFQSLSCVTPPEAKRESVGERSWIPRWPQNRCTKHYSTSPYRFRGLSPLSGDIDVLKTTLKTTAEPKKAVQDELLRTAVTILTIVTQAYRFIRIRWWWRECSCWCLCLAASSVLLGRVACRPIYLPR